MRCPTCGTVSRDHTTNGRRCQAIAFKRRAEADRFVVVLPILAHSLGQVGGIEVRYGPLDHRRPNESSALVPLWAARVVSALRLLPEWVLFPEHLQVLRRVRDNAELRQAIEAMDHLGCTPEQVRELLFSWRAA